MRHRPDNLMTDPVQNEENTKKILNRMFQNRWIARTDVTGEDHLWESYTPMGKRRMKEISDIFIDTFPQCFFNEDTTILRAEHFKNSPEGWRLILSRMNHFCRELEPTTFSEADLRTFIGLVSWYAKKLVEEQLSEEGKGN
jgi:hypothetical protein